MAQDASVSGSGNVVVQIIGDGNDVTLTNVQARLRLTRYANRRSANPGELELLDPYARALPLVGRKSELESLTQWLASSRPISIAVWTGLPGSGKTRLALELIERATSEYWNAGFLKSDELARFTEQGATWIWNCKTLVVVDNAALQATALARWFEDLADDERAPEEPLRILLVERYADQESGWWQRAFNSHGWGSRTVRRLLDPDRPVLLPRIADPDEQRSILSAVLDHLHAPVRPPEPRAFPAFDRTLVEQSWAGEPLFLIMAALVTAREGLGHVLTLRRTDLADELAKIERYRIEQIARSRQVEPSFLTHMAAIVTLCHG